MRSKSDGGADGDDIVETGRAPSLRKLRNAAIEGASQRLRPIMMTASVAIIGLLPASLSTGIGSDVQRPLATVIVYGLLAGTLITLIALPTLYYVMEARQMNKKNEKI